MINLLHMYLISCCVDFYVTSLHFCINMRVGVECKEAGISFWMISYLQNVASQTLCNLKTNCMRMIWGQLWNWLFCCFLLLKRLFLQLFNVSLDFEQIWDKNKSIVLKIIESCLFEEGNKIDIEIASVILFCMTLNSFFLQGFW